MINEKTNLVLNEILTMRSLSHLNIHSIITSFVDEMDVFVVSPLMAYGSAKLQITNKFVTGLPEIAVALILRDVLIGLEYLHKKGYIHRAIRASHILLDGNKAVLSGFRECFNLIANGTIVKELYDLPDSVKGLNWLAPEVLEQNIVGYSKASDIYSIGITICELGNGIEPYVDMSTTFMFTEKIRGNTQPLLLDYSTCPSEEITDSGVTEQTRKIYSQRKLSDGFHKIVEICLSKNPIDRPNINQLLNHSFLKQCKHTTLYEQFQSLDGLVNLGKYILDSFGFIRNQNLSFKL